MKMIFIIKENTQNSMNNKTFWLNKLEESGFRITAPCCAVIDIILNSETLLEPMEVFLQARAAYPRLGLVTVYRTLEKLEQLDLVQKVHDQNGCHAYIAAREGHQHLLVCTLCHKAEYFSGDNLSSLMDSLGSQKGYKITDHWLQLSGICSSCLKAQPEGTNDEG